MNYEMMGAWNPFTSAAAGAAAAGAVAVATTGSSSKPGGWHNIDSLKTITATIDEKFWGGADTGWLSSVNFEGTPIPNASSFENGKYLSTAYRLEKLKWIPFNNLELSKTYAPRASKSGAMVTVWHYFPQYWQLPFISPDDYFTTLQAMEDSDYKMGEDFFFLMTYPDLTGVSAIKDYVDPDLKATADKYSTVPLKTYPYRGYSDINDTTSPYAGFWTKWLNHCKDSFTKKITYKIMTNAVISNMMSQQFDSNNLFNFIKAVSDTITNDGVAGQGYIDGLINMPQRLTVNSLASSGSDAGLAQTPQQWYTITRCFADLGFAADFKTIWNDTIVASKIQLDKMIAQWNRLQTNNPPITKQEQDELFNPYTNLFLAYNPDKTAEMHSVIMDQIAKSTLTKDQPTRIQMPGMSYMYQPVLDIAKSKSLYFTPEYSYAKITNTKNTLNNPGGEPGSILPWIVGGIAAIAAVYYSNK